MSCAPAWMTSIYTFLATGGCKMKNIILFHPSLNAFPVEIQQHARANPGSFSRQGVSIFFFTNTMC